MEIAHNIIDVICAISIIFLFYKVLQLNKENKKMAKDITTLYGNEQLLISMLTAIRGRINNLYAKKTKDPSFRRRPAESDIGYSDDEHQDSI
jgi:hypothetical protein